jgi:release factor glutamine methyltransferase
MLDALRITALAGKQVLDIGTGSGVLGLFCAMRGAQVTASDIDELAIKHVASTSSLLGVKLNLVVSDLFADVPGRFDLIVFNPPYLPSESIQDGAVDGGPMGRTVVDRFLRCLPDHLRKGGESLLLVSTLNNPDSLFAGHGELEFSTMVKRQLFFEELQVLLVRLRDDLSG